MCLSEVSSSTQNSESYTSYVCLVCLTVKYIVSSLYCLLSVF